MSYTIKIEFWFRDRDLRKMLKRGCPKCGHQLLWNWKRFYRGSGWVKRDAGAGSKIRYEHVYDGYEYYYCSACDINFSVLGEDQIALDGQQERVKPFRPALKDMVLGETERAAGFVSLFSRIFRPGRQESPSEDSSPEDSPTIKESKAPEDSSVQSQYSQPDIAGVVYKEPVTRFFDPECDNGTLYLTSDAFIYIPDGINCEVCRYEIPLKSIAKIRSWRKLGFFRRGIHIQYTDRKDDRFITCTKGKDWISRIHYLIYATSNT